MLALLPRYLKESLLASGAPPTLKVGTLKPCELEHTTSDLAVLMVNPSSWHTCPND